MIVSFELSPNVSGTRELPYPSSEYCNADPYKSSFYRYIWGTVSMHPADEWGKINKGFTPSFNKL